MRLLYANENDFGLSDQRAACRTLVVEDDADSRESMMKGLRLPGYDADCAGTFLEGVAKLNPDVRWLILDLRLPDGDGTTLLRYVRQHELPVRVAVVTGDGGSRRSAEAVLLKPDAFFTKPVDFAEVATWMASCDRDAEGGNGFASAGAPE